jgi:hypothetical protein
VAGILGLSLPRADGRPLLEALRNGPSQSDYQVSTRMLQPKAEATGLTMRLPTDPDGKDVDTAKSRYTIRLQATSVSHQGKTHTYFDYAKAIRQ